MKELSRKHLQSGREQDMNSANLTLVHTVLCSATAGAAASWLTSPLDMAKLRLQIQRGQNISGAADQNVPRGMIDCLVGVFKEFGVEGLFRGAAARVIHFVPSMTITMTCYETFVPYYKNILNK